MSVFVKEFLGALVMFGAMYAWAVIFLCLWPDQYK